MRRDKQAKEKARAIAEGRAPAPQTQPKRVIKSASFPVSVITVTVTPDEDGMRVDRFLEHRFPGLSFSHIQRITRKGELRVNGKRVETKDRLEAGQAVRIPPLKIETAEGEAPKRSEKAEAADAAAIRAMILFEDGDMMVLNKPFGLAVQGGSGTVRHLDGMLESLRDSQGQKPRLVHRLDKDTSGCLVVAKTRFAASALAKSFRSRDTRKIYWSLVAGVPRVKQGRVSTYLPKARTKRAIKKCRLPNMGMMARAML